MKTKRKALTLALCAVLLVVTSVLGTLAYLTDHESVVNTFTVGQVGLVLDEKDTDGLKTDETTAGRDKKNEYHLLPGLTYEKDPTVTIDAGSEKTYVRMLVTVVDTESLGKAFPVAKYGEYYYNDVFRLEKLCLNGTTQTWNSAVWEHIPTGYKTGKVTVGEGADAKTLKTATYEFRYVCTEHSTNGVVPATTAAKTLEPLFTHITIPGALTNAEVAELANVTIKVEAHAIQADGFANADEAWAAFAE